MGEVAPLFLCKSMYEQSNIIAILNISWMEILAKAIRNSKLTLSLIHI